MSKPRVFLSSVMEGYGDRRRAARQAILNAACEPVLVEDGPSRDHSPRNACLDGVASSDAVVLILGARGGSRAPSGKLVVEEEYLHARKQGIPTFVFLEDAARDADATRLAEQVSGYVEGRYRKTFASLDQLHKEVEATCRALSDSQAQHEEADTRMKELLSHPHEFGQECVLRLVVAPERGDETIFPVDVLDSDTFRGDLVALGVDRGVGLLNRSFAKDEARGQDSLIVLQRPAQSGEFRPGDGVRIEITEDGWAIIDVCTTGREAGGSIMEALDLFPVEVETVRDLAARSLRFVSALFARHDPYARHAVLRCNASIGRLGSRNLGFRKDRERLKGQVRFFQEDLTPIACTRSERFSRTDASWVDVASAALASRLERRVNTHGSRK
jgi:hypothetical protein